jgi:hypothetical protein
VKTKGFQRMSEMKEQEESDSYAVNSNNQPYRMRLPGFILDEESGLGDAIKRVTYVTGIRPRSGCGCERRAAVLNRWIAFSPRR